MTIDSMVPHRPIQGLPTMEDGDDMMDDGDELSLSPTNDMSGGPSAKHQWKVLFSDTLHAFHASVFHVHCLFLLLCWLLNIHSPYLLILLPCSLLPLKFWSPLLLPMILPISFCLPSHHKFPPPLILCIIGVICAFPGCFKCYSMFSCFSPFSFPAGGPCSQFRFQSFVHQHEWVGECIQAPSHRFPYILMSSLGLCLMWNKISGAHIKSP